MPVEATALPGVLVVRWEEHRDDRGFFRQTHQVSELSAALGWEPRFVQGNHSRSHAGTLRGFHAEPWHKLVDVVRGTAFCAVADVRPDSATFGEVVTFTLGDPPGERARLFLPIGVANAFLALSEVDYVYDVGAEWRPDADRGAIRWDDPDLAVPWPTTAPLLSAQDRSAPRLRDRFPDAPLPRG